MSATARTLALAAVLLAWGASQADAQVIVWGGPPRVAYYPPPPLPPPPPLLPPVVYSAPPTVTFYSAPPPVVRYEAPAVSYFPTPVVVQTRYGLFGRPRSRVIYYP